MHISTVRIRSVETASGFIVINEADFDPSKHQLWNSEVTTATPEPSSAAPNAHTPLDLMTLAELRDHAKAHGIAIPATMLGKQIEVVGGPVFAILFGMVLALVFPKNRREQLAAGVTYTSKKVLQHAVILLGCGMNLSQILSKGAQSLPIIVATISTSLVIAFVLCRVMNVPGKIATLVGVGSSICGGSAIAATAPVIDADDREIAQAISVIFLFNVIAALVFPTLGGMLGLTNEGFGLFAGTAINDTSSVTAAASAWDSMHPGAYVLESASVVKLSRTLAIIPITLVLACWQMHLARKAGGDAKSTFSLKRAFPMFVLFFVLASVITTVLQLPASVTVPI